MKDNHLDPKAVGVLTQKIERYKRQLLGSQPSARKQLTPSPISGRRSGADQSTAQKRAGNAVSSQRQTTQKEPWTPTSSGTGRATRSSKSPGPQALSSKSPPQTRTPEMLSRELFTHSVQSEPQTAHR